MPRTRPSAPGRSSPGLNLPFHLKTENSTLPDTPMAQLQALEFVVLELGIYLDTHPQDTEALALFRQYTAMEKAARAAYEDRFGPLTQSRRRRRQLSLAPGALALVL